MSQDKSAQERREHPRSGGNIPVKICCGDSDTVTETKNVSRTGAYCQVNKYIEPMTKLKICLLLPFKRNDKIVTKKVCCYGVIVRIESVEGNGCFNIAIYFNEIQSKDAEYISEYVDSALNTQEPSSA